mmetsp:Transcript_43863/g.99149  ORF Transcript_43863/g.99149 Transcript_43863/m.99149 type:complete len:179 (+) Transcript_43863:57-593(+)
MTALSTECTCGNFRIQEDSVKGRGLFASRQIQPRTLLHVAPCILVSKEEYEQHCKFTVFEEYMFNARDGSRLLALGVGSLFNHSRRPNVDYRVCVKSRTVTYSTGHAIVEEGEELCIYYGADEHLWFEIPPGEGGGRSESAAIDSDGEDGEGWLRAVGGLASEDEEEEAGEAGGAREL